MTNPNLDIKKKAFQADWIPFNIYITPLVNHRVSEKDYSEGRGLKSLTNKLAWL